MRMLIEGFQTIFERILIKTSTDYFATINIHLTRSVQCRTLSGTTHEEDPRETIKLITSVKP